MPSYKVYYFNNRGRAEAIRQVLKLAGQSFEDYRVTHDEWPVLKKEMPLGQVPVLEVDGKKICPSVTALRYIASVHGLHGKNPMEAATLDAVAEIVQDLSNAPNTSKWPLVVLGYIPELLTPELKAEFFKYKVIPEIEHYAPLIEKFLLLNGNNGLFLGDKETWVDVFAAEQFSKFIDYGDAKCLDAYPHILSLISRVHSNPIIRQHIEERQPTQF